MKETAHFPNAIRLENWPIFCHRISDFVKLRRGSKNRQFGRAVDREYFCRPLQKSNVYFADVYNVYNERIVLFNYSPIPLHTYTYTFTILTLVTLVITIVTDLTTLRVGLGLD